MDQKIRIETVGLIDAEGFKQDNLVYFRGGQAPTLRATNDKNRVLRKYKSSCEHIKRYAIGGVYTSVSEGYQRGILKGVSRTLKANNHDACVVCKVNKNVGKSVNTKKNGLRQENTESV